MINKFVEMSSIFKEFILFCNKTEHIQINVNDYIFSFKIELVLNKETPL